jgi:outer membrane protein TolC
MRFRRSLASALDVYQQRQAVAATEALLPLARLREEILLNQLAALLGRTGPDGLHVNTETLPQTGPLPPIGIPAEVLANRPDVRSAERRLQSAGWSANAAKADRLPAIRLTGSLQYENSDLSELFDNWAANLAASLTGPLIDGGRRRAEVRRTLAVVRERLAEYRETVLTAILEVEDALASEQRQQEYLGRLEQQLKAAQRSYEESINRYRNGLVEYTTVLVQLNRLQGLERERVAADYNLLQYRINLYRALGGRWPESSALLQVPNADKRKAAPDPLHVPNGEPHA